MACSVHLVAGSLQCTAGNNMIFCLLYWHELLTRKTVVTRSNFAVNLMMQLHVTVTLSWMKTVAAADNAGKTPKYLEKPAALPSCPLWTAPKLMLCCTFDLEVKGRKIPVSVVEVCIVSVVSVLTKVNFRIMVSSQHWKGYIH